MISVPLDWLTYILQRGKEATPSATQSSVKALFEDYPTNKRGGKPKRKLSAWNKYVKANSKKPRFRMRNGKLNLRKMGVAFRKTPAGRKK